MFTGKESLGNMVVESGSYRVLQYTVWRRGARCDCDVLTVDCRSMYIFIIRHLVVCFCCVALRRVRSQRTRNGRNRRDTHGHCSERTDAKQK
jgi:hypothetical protein